MATLFEAIVAFGPRLIQGRTAELEDLVPMLSKRSGLSALDAEMVLRELAGVVTHQLRTGTAVKLPGLGRLRASLSRGGQLRVNLRVDLDVVRALNAPGAYRGEIRNRSRIGLDDAGFKALWDAAHPEDPMELAEGREVGKVTNERAARDGRAPRTHAEAPVE